MTALFKIAGGKLVPARIGVLSREALIEQWVEENPRLLGLDALIIGRQVPTDHGKFIDLLAIDRDGEVIIIELKKDRSPRDVVAQVLDYASWISELETEDVLEIAAAYHKRHLSDVFYERFGEGLPETLNTTHSMFIVASELDPASRRIVQYLSEVHRMAINTAFFTVFEAEGEQWLTTDFLLDQEVVEARSERKTRAPWSGYYFVNAGVGQDRAWEDMVRYGFVGASGGEVYTKPLDNLSVGDKIFAYQKGQGYIGYGVVRAEKVIASAFATKDGPLFGQPLVQPAMKQNADDPASAGYVVGVDWVKTLPIDQAKSFKGAFANQNIVCKLRDPATVDFLTREFGAV